MGQQNSIEKRQRHIELLVLVIGAVCIFTLLGEVSFASFPGIFELLLDCSLAVVAWTFYFIQYKSYMLRAYVTFAMMQLAPLIHVLTDGHFTECLSIILIANLCVALYAFPKMVFITLFVYSVELGFYFLTAKEHLLTPDWEGIRFLIRVMSVYLVQFIVFYLINRQNEIERIKDERIEELKGAEQSKDDFLANVSHEIRTPIHAINGLSTLLLQEDLPREIHERIYNIQAEGQNLLTVVSDILDFSELQSGKMESVEDEYNITTMVNDIIHMSVAFQADKDLEFIMDLDPQMPRGLVGDMNKIQRVAMNLITNALKFTTEGGVSVHFSFRQENYGINLIVEVRDTGIGMNSENLEKLFTKFSQLDGKRNRQEGGIGLGLAISKALVTSMGGFISIDSEPGRGTHVQFTIPQKVSDWEPVASVKHPRSLNAAVYINIEQFGAKEIRDAYATLIQKMIRKLGITCMASKNLSELKRRVDREYLTHLFIGIVEYEEDPEFFDELSKHIKILIILDRRLEHRIKNDRILRVFKPIYVLPVVSVLNGEVGTGDVNLSKMHHGAFIAPDARVLAVDDNRMNLKVLENLLKKYEIQVVSALSGAEALERIGSKDYDFVFMDHMMPEMDGVEVFKRIRAKSGNYYSNVPVVMLTANAVSGMREMFLAEGFNDFVAKPIELSALERVLRKFIPPSKILPKPSETPKENPVKQESESNSKEAEPVQVKPDSAKAGEDDFGLQDLDVQKGLTYCGSPEGYVDVLQMHYDEGEDNRERLAQLFAEKNWKEYQIHIHALKSSMMSIGAVGLSEQAKKLEGACKSGDEAYILSAHETMLKEYRRVLTVIGDSPKIKKKEAEAVLSESNPQETSTEKAQVEMKEQMPILPELSVATLQEKAASFEDAAFALDKSAMTVIVDELEKYSMGGKNLIDSLKPIRKKVEMDDYMSACDTLMKLKDKWIRN